MAILLTGARRRTAACVAGGALALFGALPAGAGAHAVLVRGAASSAASAARQTKVTLQSSLAPSLAGSTVSFTATVSPAVNGGTLSLTLDGEAIPGCTAIPMNDLEGVDCSVSLATAGAFTVAASYSGDLRYAASSAFVTQTVVAAGSPDPSSLVGVVIDATPSPASNSPTIAYTETGHVTASSCTIDATKTPCGGASATTLAHLAVGPHTFQITVSGGGASATASATWVVLTPTGTHGQTASSSAKPKPKKKQATRRLALRGLA